MMEELYPIINYERCDLCGRCISICPEDALEMADQGPQYKSPNTCSFCTDCEDICPQSAIRAPLSISWSVK
jgi:NAD-dependent dihydropyrimidine dehydrogenase PreA subunit